MENRNLQLAAIMHSSWALALNSIKKDFKKVRYFLEQELSKGYSFYPTTKLILRSLQQDLHFVKVLILGQDPYPMPGYANGLAFSVNKHIRCLPKSLLNIYKELINDFSVYDHPLPSIIRNGDLSVWETQGVLLLNRVLTVRSGIPRSHYNQGWEKITKTIIKILITRNQPLVAILWGQEAQSVKYLFMNNNIPCITSSHPSPLSAHKSFFGSKPFSKANYFLKLQNSKPINWLLRKC